jgi:hypothetical protein
MKFLCVRIVFFILFASLTIIIPPKLLASKGSEDREVYVASVQGDVRISRGKDHQPDLNQPWELAQSGERVGEGYALATGSGRAEVEFENGSMVYLAENALLLFTELSGRGSHIVSSMSLATGASTFFLRPDADESHFIKTPTDRLTILAPESFFARVDAFLDGTAITPQGEQGETLQRRGRQDFKFAKGQTLLLLGGVVVQVSGSESRDAAAAIPVEPQWSSTDPWELVLSGLPDFQLPSMAPSLNQKGEMRSSLANRQSSSVRDWDAWVSSRQARRSAATVSALKASGLLSPIPGLADLYEHGTFFSCKPYGTCWEAADPAEAQDSAPPSAAPVAESPLQGQANSPFQPQTVQWEELVQGWCSPPTLRTVTRVAHTPEELQKLERVKAGAQRSRYSPVAYPNDCENGYWIPHGHHYARVVTPRPRHCEGARCKPIHAPRPVLVRAGNRMGFVPAHPNDVKGKAPINLKGGILIPSKPGERTELAAVEPSQKVTVFKKAPREFRGEFFNQTLRVSAPEIHAHLEHETARESSGSLSAHAVPPITYDYKTHHFLMPASSDAGTKPSSREVAVGGIDSHGSLGSFASGHSGVYAQSFARSEAGASYHGGSFGSSGYRSGYSGGGHGSGYSSSGSSSSGSHSSGSGSSGGSSSHSSSGGGWSSGSSSGSSGGGSSSSGPSSSGGGGSRGRP